MGVFVHIEKKLGNFHLQVSFASQDLVTGLLGASGCGKSVTLQCIAGILRPDSGRIVLHDTVLFDHALGIDLPPQKRNVGYLFQSGALFPHMDVEKNLCCGLQGEQRQLADMLALLGLEGLEHHYPHQLSGGQRQRVALGRMLLSQPKLMLLDEPFSALDAALRQGLLVELQGLLATTGTQTLLVTHNREEAHQLCQHLCILEQGRITQTGTTRDVFAHPQTPGGARMVGYENVLPAVKVGAHQVLVPEWGVTLETAALVPDTLTAIAIDQRQFQETGTQNPIPVTCTRHLDGVHHRTFLCNVLGRRLLWYQVPPGTTFNTTTLWVRPEDIICLYTSASERSFQ